ncbi:nucleotidyltransferase family protein [Gottfriedia luciferensis]|uniref:hypothetical protein n=1 Tax=Gottfriedia luciferensis TaxID=178774 RepID=UPI000B44B1E3|nr:hypothetical protein [Gottfriedia luciferensis]
MSLIENQKNFFEKYKIDEQEFEQYCLDWSKYIEIYKEYISEIPNLETVATFISEILRKNPEIHTVKSRIKYPEHLIEKIIRKTIKGKKTDLKYEINVSNYKVEITDLIGIRALHLYKYQAADIDKTIRQNWNLHEKATIYHRLGDMTSEQKIDEEKFQFLVHDAGYRSWHYVIKSQMTKVNYLAEIQVRTIFEEGWSEIDHQLRYPYDLDNEILNEQLLILNRLSGGADELVNSILHTKMSIYQQNQEKEFREQQIQELLNEISSLEEEGKLTGSDKKSLEDKVKRIEEKNIKVNYSNLFNTRSVEYHFKPRILPSDF